MRIPTSISRSTAGTPKLRLAALALIAVVAGLLAQDAQAMGRDQNNTEAADIRRTMDAQVAAWNQGDIETFMKSYDDSPDTTFVGASSVNKGYDKVLARYKKNYATRALMGTLNFTDLDIRLLPSSSGSPEYAVVTGKFHLQRGKQHLAGQTASKNQGIFSLVLHRTASGWKIILDHTA